VSAVYLVPKADQDLDEQAYYLATQASTTLVTAFFSRPMRPSPFLLPSPKSVGIRGSCTLI
jgi:hypothetical protein